MRYFRQKTPYSCGSASMRMALSDLGINLDEDSLMRMMGTNESGTDYSGFIEVCEKFHLNYVILRNSKLSDLRRLISDGYTIIVNYYLEYDETGHYAVLKSVNGKVHLFDPWKGRNTRYSLAHFSRIWFDSEGDKGWLIAIKKPNGYVLEQSYINCSKDVFFGSKRWFQKVLGRIFQKR